MSETKNRKLAVDGIVRETYLAFRHNLKQHLMLSYIFYLPFILYMIIPGLSLPRYTVGEDGQIALQFGTSYLVFMLVAFLIASTLTLLFFRLYLTGSGNFLKISLPDLGRMLLKYSLYLVAMVVLLLIFLLMLTTGFGLVTTLLAKMTGLNVALQSNQALSLLIMIVITILLLGITFRLQMTFVSIAENGRFISFRESWFITRDNSLRIFSSLLLAVIPAWLLSMFLLEAISALFVTGQASGFNPLFVLCLYLASPVIFAPSSLFCSCLVRIYLRLTREKAGHIADLFV